MEIRGLPRALVALVVSSILTLPAAATAREFTGPEILSAAGNVVNVLKMHEHAMAAQLALDDTPLYFELMARGMPARFVRGDGVEAEGGLTRYGISGGAGIGQPSDMAAFGGIQFDMIGASGFPNLLTSLDETDASLMQAVFYVGVALRGVQLSWGIYGDALPVGFDEAGNLKVKGDTTTPDYDPGRTTHQLVTLQAPWGVSADASITKLPDGEQRLTSLRATVRLASVVRSLGLDDLGIPKVALERFAEGVDYFGDRFEDPSAIEEGDAYDLDLGVAGIMGTPFGARLVAEVTPSAALRVAEVSWIQHPQTPDEGRFDVAAGARVLAFKRGDAYAPSTDVFVALQSSFTGWIALSYSYNSPDAATFLPLPDAHVLGLQLVYGPVEMARPLLPISPTPRARSPGAS